MAASGAEPSVFAASDNSVASGSLWTVSVQPSFADQVFEASHLLTRPAAPPASGAAGAKGAASQTAAAAPSEFALSLKQKAVEAQGPAPAVEGDEAAEEDTQPKADPKETKEAKRKVVEELWTKVQPGCFSRADDRELDAVNNLLVSLLVSNYPPTPEAVRRPAVQLLDAVAATEGRSTPYGRYNALVTLFNALPAPLPSPESSEAPLQLSVLLRIASLAKAHPDDLSIVAPSLLRLPSYLSNWALVTSDAGAASVAEVATTLAEGGRPQDALSVALAYLRSAGALPEAVAPIAVKLALSLPDFFDWDALESLQPVKSWLASSRGQAQASLLSALKSGDAKTAVSAVAAGDYDTQTQERIEKKAKLVALAELFSQRIGGEVRYEEIGDKLGLPGSIEEDDGIEVEEWVINAIKAHLVSARLHQPSHVVYVTSCPSRHFGASEWTQLRSHLQSWSVSLDSLIATVEKSLPAGSKTGAGPAEAEKALEDKEDEARRGKQEVVKQVEEQVKTAPPAAVAA